MQTKALIDVFILLARLVPDVEHHCVPFDLDSVEDYGLLIERISTLYYCRLIPISSPPGNDKK